MPTVPYLESSYVQAEPLPGRPQPRLSEDVSAADFGGGLAQGIEQVGTAGADMQAQLARQTAADRNEAAAKLKDQNDRLRVIDANTQLEAAKTNYLYGPDGQSGAFSLHGAAAMNLPGTILPQYQKTAQDINATLTPDQQAMFAQHIALGGQELNSQLNRYEFEEHNRLANEVFSNGVQQTVKNASVGWRDPDTIMKSRLDLKSLMDLQGDRMGWSADEKAQNTQKALVEMHFNVVDRMLADGKPGAALSYFKGVRDSDELSGEQAKQLGASIDQALNQNKAQNQTAILSQMRDASAAAMNGMNIPPSSMPSKGAILAAFPEDGQRRWDALQSDIQLGSTLKGLSTLSIGDLNKAVEAERPTQVTGAADQLERYQMVAKAAQQVISQRNDDPRQAVIDNKLGSSSLDFSSMDSVASELKTRLAATQTDSERFGRYVPPLSNQEASQFAQRLQTMPAQQRAQTLASLNTGLQDDKGFQTVMHQIMPGSPVTAIVGSKLNQASPQNTPVWTDQRFATDPSEQVRTLAGEALLNPQGQEKEKGVSKIKMPPEGTQEKPGLRDAFATYSGDTFANRPELGEAMYSAFKANYVQRLAEAGKLNAETYDSSVGQAALQATVGHVGNFNGQRIAVPSGLDPARLESIVNAAVSARAKMVGLDADRLQGYRIQELGGPGSGRYQLFSGNAAVVNPGGKTFPGDSTPGLFQIDIRNQYLPSKGVQPTVVDARRQAEQAAPVVPTEQGAVPGQAPKAKDVVETTPTFKTPPVTGLGKGRGGGKQHPSQADIE